MFRSLNIAATGMAAQESQLDTISNNLANANTVGYRKMRADFQDLAYQTVKGAGSQTGQSTQSPNGLQLGSGVRLVSTSRLEAQGSLKQTGNSLDFAIEGRGYFIVQQPDGQPAYTRAGNFRQDHQGRLVTAEGYPLDPPVVIPADQTSVNIAADGAVTITTKTQAAAQTVGQIQLANFINPSGLSGLGHNLFLATGASGDAQTGAPGTDGRGSLLQGATESANVEVVEEMVAMIGAQRAYELNTKVVSAADEMLRNATQMR